MNIYREELMSDRKSKNKVAHSTSDLTELTSYNEKAQETLENIVANMPGHVYWKDKNGLYLGCNNRQARSIGFEYGSEIVGKTDFELPWGANKAEEFRKNDLHILETGETIIVEEESQVDGKSAIVLSQKSPIRNKQGEITGILGISLDISDRKKLESELKVAIKNAEAANQAKTEFLANMRHDIRTPLAGIVGFSELLKAESTEPQIKEYADNLVASSHALLHLMDEVLEAVRVSSGEIPLLKRKFSLIDTLDEVIALYQARAQEKNLKLSLDVATNLPRFVIGDKIRVHRIMLELVSNALNFTDKGYVRLQAELAKRANRDLVICLTVSDSGLGIPKDKQQEIYLQFKRLTPSYQGIYKGAGLGLYVVKQFIDELEGEIYVTSTPQKGTSFSCLIPLREPLLDDDSGIDNKLDLKIKTPQAPVPATQQTKYRVLLVEDNTIAQKVVNSILTGLSCQVDLASFGMGALMLCEKNDYDLVFMDIGLGEGIDGYDVANYIRKLPKPRNQVPIIALTAHASEENKQRCIEAGMDAVLTKPLMQAQAETMLKTFILGKNQKALTAIKRDLPEKEEAMFHLEQYSLFDSKQALKNNGNLTALKELVRLFSTELPLDLMRMSKAYEAKDYATIENIAHKIKGGAVYVSAIRMKYACQYLERYWKTGQSQLIDRLYLQAVKIIDETCKYLNSWLKKNK